MSLYGYLPPAIYVSEQQKSPNVRKWTPTAGQGILGGDIVVEVGGTGFINRAATNTSTGIVGLAAFGQGAIFAPPSGATYPGQLFGVVTGGGLLPGDAAQVAVNSFQNQILEISLINTTTWATNLLNTAVGLTLDGTTNLFVANPAGTACATIYAKPVGPNKGTVGDTGVRIFIVFNAAALA
jgi:hypothetical protein